MMTTHKGFTLVETLVAIAILLIAIAGPFYSVQQAIVASYASRDQLIASSLAQEGAEYIYFLRNSNYLNNVGWLTGMDNCLGAYGCTVDPSQSSLAACGSNGCSPLKISTSNLYTHSGSFPATRFTRTVTIQNVTATQVRVTVTVNWITQTRPFSVVVTENLYNWL